MKEGPWPETPVLEIGVVNNMGDLALKSTEEQFFELLNDASRDIAISIRYFAFCKTPRSSEAQRYVEANYEPVALVSRSNIDALIVTGSPPRASSLLCEPYWDELTGLIKWAADSRIPTILSCLAAHAGVLYFDGVERQALSQKLHGVFEFSNARDSVLMGARGDSRVVPHSRCYQLLEDDLVRAGYQILTRSSKYGVDAFVKSFGSLFVFLQGHPEYAIDSLAREYRRDMGRYLQGELPQAPSRPQAYFSEIGNRRMRAFDVKARSNYDSALMNEFPDICDLQPERALWRPAGTAFYQNWFDMVAAPKRSRFTLPRSRQDLGASNFGRRSLAPN
jgi:homoserine O-succinyltransferase